MRSKKATPKARPRVPSALILQLALKAGVCVRSAKKALAHGADSVRGLPGERCATAMREMGIEAALYSDQSA